MLRVQRIRRHRRAAAGVRQRRCRAEHRKLAVRRLRDQREDFRLREVADVPVVRPRLLLEVHRDLAVLREIAREAVAVITALLDRPAERDAHRRLAVHRHGELRRVIHQRRLLDAALVRILEKHIDVVLRVQRGAFDNLPAKRRREICRQELNRRRRTGSRAQSSALAEDRELVHHDALQAEAFRAADGEERRRAHGERRLGLIRHPHLDRRSSHRHLDGAVRLLRE